MTTQTTNFDKAAAMIDTVPRLSREAQRLSREVYRQLALGEPVSREVLSEKLRIPARDVTALLEDEQLKGWTFFDNDDCVIGFRGLAIQEMPHRFEVEGRTLYTWCAMDTLFIPEILGKPARVASPDPHTGATVHLTVTPDGVEAVEPAPVAMSLLVGDVDVVKINPAAVMGAFCHHIFFFESFDAGEAWTSAHGEGTFLVSLEEAFRLSRRFNAVQFQ